MPKKAILPTETEALINDLLVKEAAKRLKTFPAKAARLVAGRSQAEMKVIMADLITEALDGFGDGTKAKIRKLHAAGKI